MHDLHVTSLILVDTTGVVLEGIWDSDTGRNRSSLVDLLHDILLSFKWTVLIGVEDLVVVHSPAATATMTTVHASDLISAVLSVIVTSGSVNGASLISDLVLGHPLEGVDRVTTVAAIVSRAGDEDLRGDVDIGPGCLSSNLNSI